MGKFVHLSWQNLCEMPQQVMSGSLFPCNLKKVWKLRSDSTVTGRVTLSGLDNKNDIEGVFALLASCAAVVTIDNSVAHFGAVLGLPTRVVIPAGQTQFRWKNKSLKNLLFPEVHLYVQESPGVWDGAMKKLWLDISKQFSE